MASRGMNGRDVAAEIWAGAPIAQAKLRDEQGPDFKMGQRPPNIRAKQICKKSWTSSVWFEGLQRAELDHRMTDTQHSGRQPLAEALAKARQGEIRNPHPQRGPDARTRALLKRIDAIRFALANPARWRM